jgi:hypothetical protein
MVIATAGAFARGDWHRNVLLTQHAANYVRNHRRDFPRLTAKVAVRLPFETASPVGR